MRGDYYLICKACGRRLYVPKIFRGCDCPLCKRARLAVVYDDVEGKLPRMKNEQDCEDAEDGP